MRPVSVRLSAAGFSPWIELNRVQWVTNVGLAVKLSSAASLTYTVDLTFDDIHEKYVDFKIARTSTTATVTEVNHGLSVLDWIQVVNASAPFDGTYAVASVADLDTFTYTVVGSGATASANNAVLHKARIFPHSILAGLTASANSNYAFPCFATRLRVTTYGSGFADLTILQGN